MTFESHIKMSSRLDSSFFVLKSRSALFLLHFTVREVASFWQVTDDNVDVFLGCVGNAGNDLGDFAGQFNFLVLRAAFKKVNFYKWHGNSS